jgi:hypothetical protein
MKLRALLVATAAALTFSAVALATAKTTEPSKYILVSVVIRDDGITIGSWLGTKHHGDMTPLAGPVPRGDYLSFQVLNIGKKVHNFTAFGKKTGPIKPGGKAHLFTAALVRGNFPYKSTVDKGKAFRGVFTVA